MAKLQASWVHGTSVQMEREGYFLSKHWAGYGARVRTHGKEWFHFAIPTPVILDGVRSTLKKIFVFYDMENSSAKITEIHIYDGGEKFKTFKGLALTGSHRKQVDSKNSWLTPAHKMKFGLGISVHVDFGKAAKAKGSAAVVRFVTAGADFVTP